jgi:hypothetical protein
MTGLFLLLNLAQADVLHVTLAVEDGAARVLHAAVTEGDLPSQPGEIAVLDAAGEVVATAPFPQMTPFRSVVTPEGHVGGSRPSPYVRAKLPWPDGAHSVRLGDRSFVPDDLVRRQLPPPTELVPLREAGPPHRRLDLLILADGFREDERDAYLQAANRMLTHLESIEPYNHYAGLLNVWGAFTPSVDSGIDNEETPGSSGQRDTAFECFNNCLLAGVPTNRLICCDEAEILNQVDVLAPFADSVFVVANTTIYGGSGGLNYAISSIGLDAQGVPAHEIGHNMFLLWDEYSYGIDQPQDKTFISPNCAPSEREAPWAAWIDAEHPEIGTFSGCSFSDWVKPTQGTCMMEALQDRYCPVCREHMVRSLYQATGGNLLETVDPRLDETVSLGEGDTQTFRATTLDLPDGMRWSWTVGGVEVATTPDTFAYTYEGCDGPRGDVALTVSDPTDWVRTDPDALLTQTITWSVDTPHCKGDPACDGCDGSGSPLTALGTALALLLRRRR